MAQETPQPDDIVAAEREQLWRARNVILASALCIALHAIFFGYACSQEDASRTFACIIALGVGTLILNCHIFDTGGDTLQEFKPNDWEDYCHKKIVGGEFLLTGFFLGISCLIALFWCMNLGKYDCSLNSVTRFSEDHIFLMIVGIGIPTLYYMWLIMKMTDSLVDNGMWQAWLLRQGFRPQFALTCLGIIAYWALSHA